MMFVLGGTPDASISSSERTAPTASRTHYLFDGRAHSHKLTVIHIQFTCARNKESLPLSTISRVMYHDADYPNNV